MNPPLLYLKYHMIWHHKPGALYSLQQLHVSDCNFQLVTHKNCPFAEGDIPNNVLWQKVASDDTGFFVFASIGMFTVMSPFELFFVLDWVVVIQYDPLQMTTAVAIPIDKYFQVDIVTGLVVSSNQ